MEYQEITERDLPRVTELCARYLTEGQVIADEMYAGWSRGDCLGYKAVVDGRIIGLLTVRRGIQLTYPHPELERELREFVGDRPVCCGDAILILPEYRGRGIHDRLTLAVRRELRRQGVKLMLTENWIYPDGRVPSKKGAALFGRLVYEKVVPDFYRDLKRYGMRCPICGENCVCGAWLHIWEIQEERGT